LDYFDVFYSHRYDPNTPLEETMQALVDIVKQGKALYTSISNYPADKAEEAYKYLAAHNTPCLLHQCKYSMLVRDVEPEVLEVGHRHGVGLIAFSSLAQGLLTNKYLHGIPENSRAAKSTGFLQRDQVTPEVIAKVTKLNAIAEQRGQTLAEMALVWVLKDPRVTSLIVGASSVSQLKDNLNALNNTAFSPEELREIGIILNA
jgi:L-glyceraldehyde 3-phosphate reductase